MWERIELRDQRRRVEEEVRMRFLEERRREADRRAAEALAKKHERLVHMREKAVEDIERSVSRVRMGAFAYVGGKVGFYNDVREEPVPWVCFVHADGKPVYYDPLTHKSQRKPPVDAPWVDAEDDDVRWRDAVYGPGAYEQWVVDCAFKEAYNADGGHFDDEGNWVVATGYYEWRGGEPYSNLANFEFVSFDGFFDTKGRYILYPKPIGDLKFMA